MYDAPVPTEEDLSELEILVGTLPAEYRSFLAKHNGGEPEPNILVTPDNELVINYFLPLNAPRGYYACLYRYREVYEGRVPRGMLPIASAGGGDLILIQLVGPDQGKIYYWDHELECEADAFDYYENIELLAGSFNELLDRLCHVP